MTNSAAEAGSEIVFDMEAFEQEMGNAFENLIAEEMTVGVIDPLEVVEIDEDERKEGRIGVNPSCQYCSKR